MISHIFVGTNDLERAKAFYAPLLENLGWKMRSRDSTDTKLIWQPAGGGRPFFVVGRAFDGNDAVPAKGSMVALLAASRDGVDEAFRIATAGGAIDEGSPGLRPQYHPNYYGAYFRDPDGNKLCVCYHGQG